MTAIRLGILAAFLAALGACEQTVQTDRTLSEQLYPAGGDRDFDGDDEPDS